MAPVIRCALVIAGLTYLSPYRGATEVPGSVLDLGRPAAEALGVPVSGPEIELLRRLPGAPSGMTDSLGAVSRILGSAPQSEPQRSPDPQALRAHPGQVPDRKGPTAKPSPPG